MKKKSSRTNQKSVSPAKSKTSLASKGTTLKVKKGSQAAQHSSTKSTAKSRTATSAKKIAVRPLQKNPAKASPTAAKASPTKTTAKSKAKSGASSKLIAKTTPKKAASAKKPVTRPLSKVSLAAKTTKPTLVSSKQVVAKKLSGTKPAAKTPLKKATEKKPVPLQDYSQFRAILLEKRRRLYGDVAMMSEEALGSEEATVDNHAPIHPAEVGSHSFEQEFTLGLLSRDGDKIRLVDLALEKMAEGSYGVCDECGGRIPKGRLEMLPEAIYCVKCASKLEGSGP